MLTLRALGTSGSQGIGQVVRSEPYRYEVIGLPTGSGAMLAKLSGVWKILRIERGKYYAWDGSFCSAEDALASIDGHKAPRRQAAHPDRDVTVCRPKADHRVVHQELKAQPEDRL